MPCSDPVVASVLGAAIGILTVGGGVAGWRLAGAALRLVSRRARAAAIAGEADQGIR